MIAPTIRRLTKLVIAELPLLVVLGLGAGAVAIFVGILDEVLEGEKLAFDEAILLAFRDAANPAEPVGPLWLTIAVQEITALGGTTVLTLITLLAVFYLVIAGKRAAALLVFVAIAGGSLLGTVLKLAVSRPRPDLVTHLVDVHTSSFPSGHAMSSAITYLTLGALLARVAPSRALQAYFLGVAVALTLLIGTSRVYLGVHYPTDVVAGWCVGAAWAILCSALAHVLQRRGEVEKPGETTPVRTSSDPVESDAARER